MVQLILGSFTFLDPSVDGEFKCIINSWEDIIECHTIHDAEVIGESAFEDHEGYLIPAAYKGDIIWNEDVDDVQQGMDICPKCKWFVDYQEIDSDTRLCNSCHEEGIERCQFCGEEVDNAVFCSEDCAKGYTQDNQ